MRIGRKTVGLVLVALAAITAGALSTWATWNQGSSSRVVLSEPTGPTDAEPPPTPEPLEYKPLSSEEALVANDALPFANVPLEVARGINLMSASFDELSQRGALDCLTAAIYYESGYEPDQGKRAVAQVVLNRVKHPAFPNSVCGVVYQGSERRTGCQFTFTCDGSLARRPPRAAWDSARTVARAALSGTVEPTVGMSTHYHANYVVPYWASSLDKIAKIGSHLFYKWKGGWGRRTAFTQVPITEPSRDPALALDQIELGEDPVLPGAEVIIPPPSPILADRGIGLAPPSAAQSAQPPADRLAADRAGGRLIADDAQSALKVDGPSAQ